MAPKTDSKGRERKKKFSTQVGYMHVLSEFGVAFLKDGDGSTLQISSHTLGDLVALDALKLVQRTIEHVNVEEGKSWGKVKAGETVLVALKRLCREGLGGLFDNGDISLLDDDFTTAEGAPYVFKPSPQQPLVSRRRQQFLKQPF